VSFAFAFLPLNGTGEWRYFEGNLGDFNLEDLVEGIKVGIEYSPVLEELARLGAVVLVLASDEGFLGIRSPDAEVACFILATLYTFELISLDFGGQGVDGGGEILDQVRVFQPHPACQGPKGRCLNRR